MNVDGHIPVGAVEDEIRPESAEADRALHAMGLKVAMITGDLCRRRLASRRLGDRRMLRQVLPADKADAVKRFQQGGRRPPMCGDGVNDAPALATADVGIAIGAGTDVAVESAGIVLVRSDPRDVVGAIRLSRATYSKMIQNLVWATGYNLVAIPIAAGVLVPWGIDLPMAVGAIAMSLSTIIVAANAQLLRGLKLRHEPGPRSPLYQSRLTRSARWQHCVDGRFKPAATTLSRLALKRGAPGWGFEGRREVRGRPPDSAVAQPKVLDDVVDLASGSTCSPPRPSRRRRCPRSAGSSCSGS